MLGWQSKENVTVFNEKSDIWEKKWRKWWNLPGGRLEEKYSRQREHWVQRSWGRRWCLVWKSRTETNMLEVSGTGSKWWQMTSGDNRGPDHSGVQMERDWPVVTQASHTWGPSINTPDLPQPPLPRTWSKAQGTTVHGKTCLCQLSCVYV